MSPIAQSTTEQRALVPIAHSCAQHGQGSQSYRFHEPLVRARAVDSSPLSFFNAGPTPRRRIHMLYSIALILLVAWLLGIVGTYTLGPLVHVLLVVAIVLFLVGLVSGRRKLA